MTKLLTPAANSPKLAHGLDKPIEAAVLYLAPFTLGGGPNVCPFASPGCAAGCLNTAGRGGIGGPDNTIQRARRAKTQRFHNDRAGFMKQLVTEVAALSRKAYRNGKQAAVRLNGTSDIAWERIPVDYTGVTHVNIMAAFPTVIFYDYTKVVSRIRRTQPSNYFLTFSLSESNDAHAAEALANGYNVAVVMQRDYWWLPETWSGHAVINGDAHDYRFLDPRGGYIIALTPKGKAKKDTTGFVRSADSSLDVTRKPVYASQALPMAAD